MTTGEEIVKEAVHEFKHLLIEIKRELRDPLISAERKDKILQDLKDYNEMLDEIKTLNRREE